MRNNYAKLNILILLLGLSLLSVQGHAQEYYTLTDADVEMFDGTTLASCNYDFSIKHIIIPDKLHGQYVERIFSQDFMMKGIKSIVLPSRLKKIEDNVFYGNEIESVVIPDNYIEFGTYVFNKNAIKEINNQPSKGFIYAKNKDGSDDLSTIVSYGGKATNINFIPNTVTHIADFAFASTDITQVSIPTGVQSIGSAAFNYNKITHLNGLPFNGLIFDRQANGQDDLTSLVSYCGNSTLIDFIPATVKKIGKWTFQYANITEVIIPSNVEIIEEGAFAFNIITKLTFQPNSHLRYMDIAFNENSGLMLQLPQSAYFGFRAWIDEKNNGYQAGEIVSVDQKYMVKVPYTLTDADVIVDGGHIISVSNTNKASEIIIPDMLDGQDVISIRPEVFSGKYIAMIHLPTHKNLQDFKGWLDEIGDEITLQGNGNYLIRNFQMAYYANLPSYTLTSYDVDVDAGCLDGTSYKFAIKCIRIPEILDGQKVLYVKGFEDKQISSVSLPSALLVIGNDAFQGNPLINVELPPTLEYIGESAFQGCPLKKVVIPAKVKEIARNAFYGAHYGIITSKLEQVTFEKGSKLETIGNWAFGRNKKLSQLTNFPQKIKVIGQEAFKLSGLSEITIPAHLEHLGAQAFAYNKLTKVVFEEKSCLPIISESAFAGNNLENFTLPSSTFEDFEGWCCNLDGRIYQGGDKTSNYTAEYKALRPYVLKDEDVEVVDGYIKTYNVPDSKPGILIIPDVLDGQKIKGLADSYPLGLFYSRGLHRIQLPSGLEYIGSATLSSNNLAELKLPSSVVHIGFTALSDNQFESIILPHHNTAGFVGWLNEDGKWVKKNEKGQHELKIFDEEKKYSDNFSTNIAAYEVIFNDHDGTCLKKEPVRHGTPAIAPEIPVHAGLTFTGWDKSFEMISEGITVTAQYSLATSVDKLKENKRLKMYPNPTKKYIRVKSSVKGIVEVATLKGLVIEQEIIEANVELSILMSAYESGIYLLRLYGIDGAIETHKFILKE